MQTVSKETPLAEITLRKYEKPYGLTERELIKKLCLSLGLLQPGDSRDILVDILLVLIKSSKELDSKEIEALAIESRKNNNLELKGIASSNIRRQLKRLKDIFILESINNKYRITEKEKLSNIFKEKIEKYYINSILERVKEYITAVDNIK
ncbi:hypothetical protein J4405_00875 [Candidatus Woesearchaeota archaeon]|nr:hypothetical protein [Candidatus Woesearchaeota archaeon]